ncbi:MAG: hypothetical protein EG825_02730 [Rhodocyclaceae bacterium]|nr:hypothetical protein [Rhodocyclaceae bacterium]
MLGEILTTLNIGEKVWKFIGSFRQTKLPQEELLSSRFVRLFECHNVHRNQIPRFFGSGLTVKDVSDDQSLLSKLEEPLLDAACTLFGVRREWLDGAEPQVYSCHSFYKDPGGVLPFLTKLKEANPEGQLGGILIAPVGEEGEALVLLNEIIGWVGDKPIHRYHLCNDWTFDYWKARAYLTAFVAICWKHGVHLRGTYLPEKEIKRIADGEALICSEDGDPGVGRTKLWYPEDMALKPDVFLAGVDPERDQFGIKSALKLWLDLEQQGYMDTGLAMTSEEAIRATFEAKLAGYL